MEFFLDGFDRRSDSPPSPLPQEGREKRKMVIGNGTRKRDLGGDDGGLGGAENEGVA